MRAALTAATAISNRRVGISSASRAKAARKICIVITVAEGPWVNDTYARWGVLPRAQPVPQTQHSWPWRARNG